MNITPIDIYLLKRKLYFILQLIKNKATYELVIRGIHHSLDDVLNTIGVKIGDMLVGSERYIGVIGSLVTRKLEEIKLIEKTVKESEIVTAVGYLLDHRSRDNDSLQYLLDPRRGGAAANIYFCCFCRAPVSGS
jgi:hypothetical protein